MLFAVRTWHRKTNMTIKSECGAEKLTGNYAVWSQKNKQVTTFKYVSLPKMQAGLPFLHSLSKQGIWLCKSAGEFSIYLESDGEWKWTVVLQCPPLKGKVAKILTWRWAKPPEQEDELDHTHHDKPKKSVSSIVCSLSTANFNSMRAVLYFRELQLWKTYLSATKLGAGGGVAAGREGLLETGVQCPDGRAGSKQRRKHSGFLALVLG